MSDRDAFREARDAGLRARHETREVRAVRKDPVKALAYLLAQYDRVVEVHEHVVMDTPEDRELHDRAVATFREAAEPIRTALPDLQHLENATYTAAEVKVLTEAALRLGRKEACDEVAAHLDEMTDQIGDGAQQELLSDLAQLVRDLSLPSGAVSDERSSTPEGSDA